MDASAAPKRSREAVEVAELKRRCTGLEEVQKKDSAKIKALEARNKALDEKNKELDEKNKELIIGTDGDGVTINAMQAQLGQERDVVRNLRNDLRDLRSQLSAIDSRANSLRAELDKALTKAASRNAECQVAKQDYEHIAELARVRGLGLERFVGAYTLSPDIELTPKRLREIFTESRGAEHVPAQASSVPPSA